MAPAQNRPAVFFPSIDILRGFAALSVLLYHVIQHFKWKSFPVLGPLTWFRSGGLAVDLFFVISGFVIAMSCFEAIERQPRQFRTPYLTRRYLRLAPLHYLTCLVFVWLFHPAPLSAISLETLLAHLTFLHALSPEYFGAINGVNWSISIEMQFYLLMALLAPWLMRAHPLRIAIYAMAIAVCWRWIATLQYPVNRPGESFELFFATRQLPGTLDEFAAGILLARTLHGPAGQQRLLRLQQPRIQLALLVLAACCVTLTLKLYWVAGGVFYWAKPAMVVLYKIPLALSFMLLALSACSLNQPGWLAFTAPLRYLGTISYGIYLWHLPVIEMLKGVEGMTPARACVLVVTITLVLAALSWHLLEKPAMRLGKR